MEACPNINMKHTVAWVVFEKGGHIQTVTLIERWGVWERERTQYNTVDTVLNLPVIIGSESQVNHRATLCSHGGHLDTVQHTVIGVSTWRFAL